MRIVTDIDITLEDINRELEAFTHSVCHDLRTPLRFTNKIAHLLLHEHSEELSAGAQEKVQMILNSTAEMGKLIEDLLMFSQVNRHPIKKQRVALNRLVAEVVDDLEREQVGWEVDIDIQNLPPADVDRALLKQVLLNLVTNALKFTRQCEHARVSIGSMKNGEGEVVYFVRDNGVGFDTAFSEAIFIPFRRLAQAQTVEGSGIGLALARRIVERHGGRIWAESSPGEGATFLFTLDAAGAAPPNLGA